MAKNIVEKIDDLVKIKNVMVSVSDKGGLERLVPELIETSPSIRFYSTGGTLSRLGEILGDEAGKHLTSVSDYTGQPEMQGGLVKTLDFKLYLGLLGETYNEAHKADLKRVGGIPFDMVVVNLYPFKETISREGATPEEARANIDIGGPCMVRAAAKNFIRVAAVIDPQDYSMIAGEMRESKGCLCLKTRYELARKAFKHTASYDSAISEYLIKTDFDRITRSYPTIVR